MVAKRVFNLVRWKWLSLNNVSKLISLPSKFVYLTCLLTLHKANIHNLIKTQTKTTIKSLPLLTPSPCYGLAWLSWLVWLAWKVWLAWLPTSHSPQCPCLCPCCHQQPPTNTDWENIRQSQALINTNVFVLHNLELLHLKHIYKTYIRTYFDSFPDKDR